MVKVFTTNKNGKIEFTKEEIEELLNEVWRDGYNANHTYTWTSPWISTTPYYDTNKWSITTCNADDKITLTTHANNPEPNTVTCNIGDCECTR